MKTETKESTWFDNLLSIIWCLTVLIGTCYLVFWVGISPWWFLLSIALLHVDVYSKKVTVDN